LSHIVVVLTGAVLFYVAFTDFKHYKIRNEVILVLAGLFLLYVLLVGSWTTLAWNFGFAALAFLFMLPFYSMGLMGGGDLKLLTVALLWVGPFCAVPFAVFLLIFASIHTLAAKLKFVKAQVENGSKQRIPFAPSVAAALISIFLVGCLSDNIRSDVYNTLGMWLHRLVRQVFPGMP
jgi:Flp pilus assembly protein protease CpaA